ncbi:MAG: maleylpyruvate isomerase family mycothiol-dependent enzyme [Propionicimonas sp.]|uniref:maleylpyruvate isomerase family mycothiol-dependent enzyme n=1 Tax=Propionicimonas sp. TaxID=1955623 RepID=UPI002B217827|nr:maleylpyruvate isomerase family mycothiol-dependent enzyme [Propionicimonas sp.]MEA4942985.1 maleylpyruvate isomerase family mycothiol-dependent enzyme [Propionicimonas sp.]MEA5054570.1 maleylpyruvate isomerase family mycothiol-dependent enzyme [Propionicimonas sp.]MEA5118686.1 maleylpyruvate isomerase family mycothiol-dependent enzyme [Propionicimonas sp.]
MTQLGGSLASEEVRLLERDANQLLLHDTIGIPEEVWRGQSLLPGWSRAHVATHVARNADRLRRLTESAISAERPAEPGPEERFEALERGAERSALELQIDLDTSAAALEAVWHDQTDWHRPINFLGRVRPLSWLPVARLHELCVHHLDLDIGFTADQINPETAHWLLTWVCQRLGSQAAPALAIQSDSGQHAVLGQGEPTMTVRGSDAGLWAWLAGRAPLVDPDGIELLPRPLLA